MYKTIIFDLDGTLINSFDDLFDAVSHTLEYYGYQKLSKSTIKSFVGNGLKMLLTRSLEQVGDEKKNFDIKFQYFLNYYSNHSLEKTLPYPEIISLLEKIYKEKKLFIISNKADKQAKKICKSLFKDYFIDIIGEKNNICKPNKVLVNDIIDKYNLNKKEILLVGDSEVDYMTATNSLVDCCLVSWGFRDRDFLTRIPSKYLIDSVDELLKIII